MSSGHRTIKGLGEIALRVEDLDTMQHFYEEVIGLELIKRFHNASFLKLADGYDGHTQVLALFDRKAQAGYMGLARSGSTSKPNSSASNQKDVTMIKGLCPGNVSVNPHASTISPPSGTFRSPSCTSTSGALAHCIAFLANFRAT